MESQSLDIGTYSSYRKGDVTYVDEIQGDLFGKNDTISVLTTVIQLDELEGCSAGTVILRSLDGLETTLVWQNGRGNIFVVEQDTAKSLGILKEFM